MTILSNKYIDRGSIYYVVSLFLLRRRFSFIISVKPNLCVYYRVSDHYGKCPMYDNLSIAYQGRIG